MRSTILTLLIMFSLKASPQNNPGYVGKTHAIGVHLNIGPLNKNLIYPTYYLKFEQTYNETSSIEFSGGYFKSSFKPNEYLTSDYSLRIEEGDQNSFESHRVYNITGDVLYNGIQYQIGLVKYLRIFGGMAPYGKRLSLGYYNNRSKVEAQNNTYKLFRDNSGGGVDSYEYTSGVNSLYKYKKTSGIYFEIGEKKIVKNDLFFQYSLQVNIPITSNYADNELNNNYRNYQDMYENIMKKNILNNNLLCLYFGIGILIK